MAHQFMTDPSEFDQWLGEDFGTVSEDFDKEEFPVLPLRDTVVYPHLVAVSYTHLTLPTIYSV